MTAIAPLPTTVHVSEPDLGPDVETLVLEVLRSGQLAQGPMVARFEELCAIMAGTRHAVAVSNGTASLEVALEALGIGPGDEVITSPLTFAATLNAILRAGATARFADVTSDFTVDPRSVASLVGARTAAILPVHLYGLPADMPMLSALAHRHGLAMVEDAAQSHGADVKGQPVGSFGVGSFSFYATKNVTAGEGGVVTTDSNTIADRVRLLRNQGMRQRYRYEVVGRNLRMTDLQAAVAIPQLERLASISARRQVNAAALSEHLLGSEIVLPTVPVGRSCVWHQYTVLLPAWSDREMVIDRMAACGVQVGVYYPTVVWDHDVYRRHPRVVQDPSPVAHEITRRCLSLPVHPRLSEEEIGRVADALRSAVGT
jgi:dTDP-4-amino-4,6-dideoxygalactose transaminase